MSKEKERETNASQLSHSKSLTMLEMQSTIYDHTKIFNVKPLLY